MGLETAQLRPVNTASWPGVSSPRMMNRPPTKTVTSWMALTSSSIMGKKVSHSLLMRRWLSMKAWFFSSKRSFSYSSRAKALTTRLPAMFSWAAVFISLSFSRMKTKRGRTCLEKNLVIKSSTGVITISKSVSFQLTMAR